MRAGYLPVKCLLVMVRKTDEGCVGVGESHTLISQLSNIGSVVVAAIIIATWILVLLPLGSLPAVDIGPTEIVD